MTKARFMVPIEVEVHAETIQEAESEVMALMEHGFETSNDQGIFQSYRLHETSDTIKVN